MAVFKWMKNCVLGAICVAIVSAQTNAAEPGKKIPFKVADVSLAKEGLLVGRVLTSTGTAQAGSDVVLRYNGRTVARTRTDAQGRYAIKGVRGGIHEVLTPKGRQVVRLWSPQTAPPIARPEAVLVNSGQVVRGQIAGGPDLITLGLLGLTATTTYYVIDNDGDIDDLESQVGTLQNDLNGLRSQVANLPRS